MASPVGVAKASLTRLRGIAFHTDVWCLIDKKDIPSIAVLGTGSRWPLMHYNEALLHKYYGYPSTTLPPSLSMRSASLWASPRTSISPSLAVELLVCPLLSSYLSKATRTSQSLKKIPISLRDGQPPTI